MFITFEGPDGSGKTTQARLLAAYLRQRQYAVLHTREPGGTPIGDQIRQVVHDLKNQEMHPHTEVLLYSASRAQLVAQVIRPHLLSGGIVICDRYADSTLAYQGYGHGLDLAALRSILHFATGGLKPDLTFYFDISVEAALERRKNAADEEWNRMDAQTLDFHRRMRAGYATFIAEDPARWLTIDATQSIETLHQHICDLIHQRLPTQS